MRLGLHNVCMPQYLRRYISIIFSCLLLGLFPITAVNADYTILANKHLKITQQLEQNIYGVPIFIESGIEAQSQRGDVYGIIHHPFNEVKTAFSSAQNWCDVAPLHLNIKACTYQKLNGDYQLTLYSGRKFFEEPEDTHQLVYRYHLENQQDNYIKVTLSAEEGPLGTSDYGISSEAIPLGDNKTFVHFSYSYKQGFWTRMAMKTYLATIGRDKIGFTPVGTDANNKPIYINGIRGVIERNAIRYYFAIKAYLDTRGEAPDKIFMARLNHWFELTEQHHEQLFEMEKKEYLEYKQKERAEQIRLQQAIK